MKKRVLTFAAAAWMLSSAMPAMAAPLFPDVRDDHWAKDAVAKLAAQGLLEGYPDGTFKGDRAATRWEVAMIVARLLAKMEQANATFATKAELDEVRKLANALKEELDALGVRVTNLEENVSRLDKRVSELERITFYGYVDTRMSGGAFTNNANLNNSGGGLGAGTVPIANYSDSVGSAVLPSFTGGNPVGGGQLTPWNNGVLPVADFTNGRPLINGVGFTARAVLGLRVRVSDDIDAGAEFSAFTSQGNQFIDAYWGVTAPWQSNTFTSNSNLTGTTAGLSAGLNGGGNSPYSRMTLDSFWVVHNPSSTKAILGAFQETNMDSLVYAGQYNPGAYGPRYLGGFGFDINGKVELGDTGIFRWEALGTRLGDNNAYDTYLVGGDLEFEFEGGNIRGSIAKVGQEVDQSGLGARTVGNSTGIGNGSFFNGLNSWGGVGTGFGANTVAPLQWVNPGGYLVGQPGVIPTGAGTTTDNRPIPGQGLSNAYGGVGAFNSTAGSIGPQTQFMYGANGGYKFDFGDGDFQVYVNGNYAHTDYRPNQNSNYEVGGNAYKGEIGINLLDGDLDISGQYLHVDSTYDPYILRIGGLGQLVSPFPVPNFSYYQGLYSLHDVNAFPQNREGFRGNLQFRFDERRGLLWGKVSYLEQVDTSLYDVRIPGAGAFGSTVGGFGGVSTGVMGFSPGFMDPVFRGYASPLVYGGTSANAFTAGLAPLEDRNGSHWNWGVGGSYKFDDPGIKIDVGYERNEFFRDTSLAGGPGGVFTAAGSQNYVDVQLQTIHGAINFEVSDKWTLRGGMDYTLIDGHYDPAGRYNQFAAAVGTPFFNTMDSEQFSPFVGFDYDVSTNTSWSVDARYYSTQSNLNIPTTGVVGAAGSTNNPFEWNGWQLSTQFKVKF